MSETEFRNEGHRRLAEVVAREGSQAAVARRIRVTEAAMSLLLKRGSGSIDTINALAREYGIGQPLWSEPARSEATS